MAPGLYSDIGKKARDLLYKDYQTDKKFSVTTYSTSGVAITTSGTKKNELIVGEVQTQLKHNGITTDLKVNSDADLFTTVTIDELAPGFKTILSLVFPVQRSGKVELQYLHDYAGVSASFGLAANPVINFATAVGTGKFVAGADLSFDTASGMFSKYNAGVNFTDADLTASVLLNDKGENLTASYYQVVSPLTSTTVGAELTHSFSSNENTLTFGAQHAVDPLTVVKARFNSLGKASALIQHEWRPKSFVAFSGEVDTRAVEKGSKVGLSVLLKP